MHERRGRAKQLHMNSPFSLARGLYAIADFDSCLRRGLDPYQVAAAMVRAQVAVLQLRAKSVSDEDYLSWIQATLVLCGETVPLFVNDRLDLALLAGAPGVHLGQDDLPVEHAKRLDKQICTGLSTHDLEQIKEGLVVRPSYLAFGPVFATTSKSNAEPTTGLLQLQAAHQLSQASGVPLVAIGGISDTTLDEVAPHCELIAAISLLLPDEADSEPYAFIEQRCSALQTRLKDARLKQNGGTQSRSSAAQS